MQTSQQRLELISRVVIFLPIVIVVVLVLVQSSKPKKAELAEESNLPMNQQQTQQKAENTIKEPKTDTISLDLKGPYLCNYKDEQLQATIRIKNRNIFVTYIQNNKTNNILINGDCGYNWEQGANKGMKLCGISEFLSMAEAFSTMGLGNMTTMLEQLGPSISIAPEKISAISNSCKKQDIDENVFVVPTTLTFTEESKP